MTALLSVQRDDLGQGFDLPGRMPPPPDFEILPPDVNHSQLGLRHRDAAEDGSRANPLRPRRGQERRRCRAYGRTGRAARRGAFQPVSSTSASASTCASLGKRSLESLIKGRRHGRTSVREPPLWPRWTSIVSYSSHYHHDQEVGQMDHVWRKQPPAMTPCSENLKHIEEYEPARTAKMGKELLLAFYLTGRPVDRLSSRSSPAGKTCRPLSELQKPCHGETRDVLRVAGEITEPPQAHHRKAAT